MIDGLKSAIGKVKHQEIQRGSKAPCHSQVGRFGAQRTPPIPQKDDMVLVLVRRPAVETRALGASRAHRAERLTLSTGSFATSTSASVATLGLTVLGPGEIFHPKSLKSIAEVFGISEGSFLLVIGSLHIPPHVQDRCATFRFPTTISRFVAGLDFQFRSNLVRVPPAAGAQARLRSSPTTCCL